MSNFESKWTPEQDKVLRDNRGLSIRELARLVSLVGPARTDKGVQRRRARLFGKQERNPPSTVWLAREVAIIRQLAPTTSDRGIAEALKEAGFNRTEGGVKRARERHRILRGRAKVKSDGSAELKTLPGTHEERDRKFVRMVLQERLRLGLFRKAA